MIQQVQTQDLTRNGFQPAINREVGTPSQSNGLQGWSKWIGRRHYSLEIVQDPLRARMCGFGDKDRRPLAPAAVCKMVVRREDNSIIDVDDVDGSFFLVTVDLWSTDGLQEMNLVGHSTSTSTSNGTTTTRPKKTRRVSRSLQAMESPVSPHTSLSKTNSPTTAPAAIPIPVPAQQYDARSQTNGSIVVPSMQSYASAPAPAPGITDNHTYPPSITPPGSTTWHSAPPHHQYPPQAPSSYYPPPPALQRRKQSQDEDRPVFIRTLVGPLAASAAKLNDEHGQPGWFFVFQDLSVRTEGDFRLRLRLMNVGIHPTPTSAPSSPSVHTSTSSIMAQIFTEPFIVYSAKRFPGVPDPTPLLLAFSAQGQKLPLRNRHGKPERKRKRKDEDDDDESS